MVKVGDKIKLNEIVNEVAHEEYSSALKLMLSEFEYAVENVHNLSISDMDNLLKGNKIKFDKLNPQEQKIAGEETTKLMTILLEKIQGEINE